MRDPFSWSIPLGRVFGIRVRVHLLFPLVALAVILRFGLSRESFPEGTWRDALELSILWFLAVFLHELGHCFGARQVNGDASEILLWPLGGLAEVDIPANPRAHFVTALCGPLVNLALCLGCLVGLFFLDKSFQPPWNPFWYPFRQEASGVMYLLSWDGEYYPSGGFTTLLLARFFYLNWSLFLVNVLLLGFPMDGGRILQSILWPRIGLRQSTLVVIFTGFGCMFVVGFLGLVFNEVMVLCLAAYIYVACKAQWMELERQAEEEQGLDFSTGYTSYEAEEEQAPQEPRLSWFQRWKKARQDRKRLQLLQKQEADELRMDKLLDKLHREGGAALSAEEHRFMKQFSDRYRNRH